MKRMTALLSASAFALGGLAGVDMLAPATASAAPVCGGSIDDWRGLDAAASYSGTVKDDQGTTEQRTASLEGGTAWVPGKSDSLIYTFTEGKLTWGTGDEHGSRSFTLSSPECAQGGTRVTSALYEESDSGMGGSYSMEGRLTRA